MGQILGSRPDPATAAVGHDAVGQIPITNTTGSGLGEWGTGRLDLNASNGGSDDQSERNPRGAVDPAVFGIDAADVGAEARTVDSSSKEGVTSEEPTAEEMRLIKDDSDIIQESFIWYDGAAGKKLEQLRRDLKTEDQPSWSERIAAFALEAALGAGAQASGLALAKRVVSGDASREFMQNIFASGVTGGVAAGKVILAGGRDGNVIDPFIDAQVEGVSQRQQRSQTEFIRNGRQKLKSVSQARDLAAACDRDHVTAAAAHQYQTSRDSWVSYIAQQKFGSSAWGGRVTTNMTNQASRDREAARKGGYLPYPKQAPDPKDSVLGHSPGVLTVVVDLPAIRRVYDVAYGGIPQYTAAFEMNGSPKVAAAMLGGVNDVVRAQYVDRPLASCLIPRQVVARVSGNADFTLNLDEKGNPAHRPTDMKWLASRAVVANPERSKFDDDENHWQGMQLLLNDVRLAHIDDKLIG